MTYPGASPGCRRSLARLLPLAIALAVLVGSIAEAADNDENGAASERLRLNPLNALKWSDLKAFKEKPLFTPSRRPPPVAARPADPVPRVVLDAPKVNLAGVVEGAEVPMAILQRADASGAMTVRVGDQVDGWLVASIDSLRVLLKDGDRQREYRLFDPNARITEAEPAPALPGYKPNPKVDLGANIRKLMRSAKAATVGGAPAP